MKCNSHDVRNEKEKEGQLKSISFIVEKMWTSKIVQDCKEDIYV